MDLFAGARVRDFGAARQWYERLLGREPSFLPHDTEAVWELAEHRFLYVVEDPERAGRAAITVMLDDVDATVEDITARGIEPALRERYDNGVQKITYRDADGNEIAFGSAPQ